MTEKDFFEQQGRIQRDITIERYRQLNKSVTAKEIVFAGSSLAEQFPINEMLMSRNLSHIIYNRGVSGDVIDGLVADLDTLIIDLNPSKLFINIGSNDIGGESYNEDLLFTKYCQLLETIATRLPLCKIHVLAYYPVNPTKESFLNDMAKKFMFANRTNENIRHINSRLKRYCSDNNHEYINVHDILLDDDRALDPALTVEGIHLWPKAYDRILDVLQPFFHE